MTEFPWDYRSITEYSIKTKKKLKDEKRKEKKNVDDTQDSLPLASFRPSTMQ